MKNNINNYKTEKGVTLVEIMLSVALLLIIVTPLLGAVVSAVKNNTAAKDKTEAIALAEEVMGEIKARESIVTTTPSGIQVLYKIIPDCNLVPYYDIALEDSGSVAESTEVGGSTATPSDNSVYTYATTASEKPDFVLEIDQGTSTRNGEIRVTFKDNDPGTKDATLDISVTDTALELIVTKLDDNYSYQINVKTITGTVTKISSGQFNPNDSSNIKLKVTYSNILLISPKQLKIFTNIISDVDNIFKVYVINNGEANLVKFINKGKTNFEINYMDNDVFNYSNTINNLYKINVTIKKDTKEIYKTSSYVKKY
jgi:type II secretory pathway pseudopilin PulG